MDQQILQYQELYFVKHLFHDFAEITTKGRQWFLFLQDAAQHVQQRIFFLFWRFRIFWFFILLCSLGFFFAGVVFDVNLIIVVAGGIFLICIKNGLLKTYWCDFPFIFFLRIFCDDFCVTVQTQVLIKRVHKLLLFRNLRVLLIQT